MNEIKVIKKLYKRAILVL